MAKTADNSLRGLSLAQLRNLGLIVEEVFEGSEASMSNGPDGQPHQFGVTPVVLFDFERHGPNAPAETIFKPVVGGART